MCVIKAQPPTLVALVEPVVIQGPQSIQFTLPDGNELPTDGQIAYQQVITLQVDGYGLDTRDRFTFGPSCPGSPYLSPAVCPCQLVGVWIAYCTPCRPFGTCIVGFRVPGLVQGVGRTALSWFGQGFCPSADKRGAAREVLVAGCRAVGAQIVVESVVWGCGRFLKVLWRAAQGFALEKIQKNGCILGICEVPDKL